ncbi:hypothetical protein [Legionella yabuuchiae]|uniref:hypothetical protein n=1 Tax=Legionella yabuuchiae TaxID=376727 RepID=UPI0010542AD4|nr:hypothetical protein [Legionella yabuuchiae]
MGVDDVLKTIAEALHLLSKAALMAEAYVRALEVAGVDTKGTLDILQRIKTIAEASGDVTDALSKIKVPNLTPYVSCHMMITYCYDNILWLAPLRRSSSRQSL